VKGTLSIAVIPTIAPFLLPKFLHHFAHQFPKLSIEVREQNTAEIIRNLHRRELDIGILSTPLKEPELKEYPLYDEPFVFFNMKQNAPTTVQPRQLDVSQICLLEEGHCMRTQVLELCDFYDKDLQDQLNFRFRAGSVHSLLRFVVANQASTLLPALATMELSEAEKNKVSQFASPIPYRSVGLVVHRHFVKNKIRGLLQKEIQSVIQPLLDQVKSPGTQLQPVKT
jgi:LysR family hydrogen peroxide-inducible transcriptional activator